MRGDSELRIQKANIPSNFFYCQLSFFPEHLIRNRGFEYWGWFDNATEIQTLESKDGNAQ